MRFLGVKSYLIMIFIHSAYDYTQMKFAFKFLKEKWFHLPKTENFANFPFQGQ